VVFCADAAKLPLRDESFDVILASMVLQHVHDDTVRSRCDVEADRRRNRLKPFFAYEDSRRASSAASVLPSQQVPVLS